MIDAATVLAENEEHLVRLDMDMSDEMVERLVKYAETKMSKDELETLKIEWAVQDIMADCMEHLETLDQEARDNFIKKLAEDYQKLNNE